jgi:hypothetical protein
MDAHTFLKSENYRQKRSELTQTNFVNEHLTRELFKKLMLMKELQKIFLYTDWRGIR